MSVITTLSSDHRYFVCYKPRNMVSQFKSSYDVPLLDGLGYNFPEGIHAVGRLDRDSEGLLLLTTDKRITKLLFESGHPHERTYLVEVSGVIKEYDIRKLKEGITITIKGGAKYLTKAVDVQPIAHPEEYVEVPPNPHPQDLTSWLTITLTEGKYHQVRKMVAALYHPCRRLIRISIADMLLEQMKPGEIKEFDRNTFFEILHL